MKMVVNRALQNEIKSTTTNNIMQLILYAYTIIKTEPLAIIREDNRRNQLISKMRMYQDKFGVTASIANSDEFDSSYNTIGKTDIAFLFGSFNSRKVVFECKRVKDNSEICKSYVQNQYHDEGVARFTSGKYPVDFLIAGMITFIESGDYKKWFSLLKSEYTVLIDESKKYNHLHVGMSSHVENTGKSFDLMHLVLNFN